MSYEKKVYSSQGYGPSVTVPVHLLKEKVPEKEDNFRYIGIAEDLGHMMVWRFEVTAFGVKQVQGSLTFSQLALQIHRKGEIYDKELFEKILQGQPVSLSPRNHDDEADSETSEDNPFHPEEWHRKIDEKGRAYYKNERTKETRWTRPSDTNV